MRILFSPKTRVMSIHYFTFPKILADKKTILARNDYFNVLTRPIQKSLKFKDEGSSRDGKELSIPTSKVFLRRNKKSVGKGVKFERMSMMNHSIGPCLEVGFEADEEDAWRRIRKAPNNDQKTKELEHFFFKSMTARLKC